MVSVPRNKRELRCKYEAVYFYEHEMLPIARANCEDAVLAHAKEHIADLKRAIRTYNHRQEKLLAEPEYLVKDYGIDGYVIRFPLPAWVETEEDAEEYFREELELHYRPSMYDCTGQLFTSWHKIYRKPDGSWWCYHSIACDV